MLAFMRKGAVGWFARILLAFLIISFGIWGIGDFIRGTGSRDVATVGSVKIPAQEFDQQYRRDLQVWQQRFNTTINSEQAKQLGLQEATLQNMIQRVLIDQEIDRLGLAADDATLIAQIKANPAFQSSSGQFDRFIFERTLANNGFSEAGYVARLRRDYLRDVVLQTIAAGVSTAPSPITDAIFSYRNEKRVVEWAMVPGPSQIPEPDRMVLEKFHQDNAARFTAPEYRSATYVRLAPEDLLSDVSISSEEIKEEYDAKRQSFQKPERRDIQQLIFPEQAAALAAYEKIKGGTNFSQAGKELRNLSAADINLGFVTKTDLPSAIGDAAFSLALNAPSMPIQTPFGWHIIRAIAIEPAKTQTLEDVSADLKQAIGLRKAAEKALTVATQAQDEISGGAKLEQIAEKFKLKVIVIAAIDREGKDQEGKPAPDTPAFANFIPAVFEGSAGADPQILEATGNSYLIFRIDSIAPSALKPFTTVHGEVLKLWRLREADRIALERANALVGRVKEGGNFTALVKDAGSEIKTSMPFTRNGAGLDPVLPPRLAGEAFIAKQGEALAVAAPEGKGAVVAKLLQIQGVNPTGDTALRARFADNLRTAIVNDFGQQYQLSLESEFGVRVNRAMLETLYGN